MNVLAFFNFFQFCFNKILNILQLKTNAVMPDIRLAYYD